MSSSGWILTRGCHDRDGQLQLEYWLATPDGPQQVLVGGTEAVFFVPVTELARVQRLLLRVPGASIRPLQLKSLSGGLVSGVYCSSRAVWLAARRQLEAAAVPLLEADIAPEERYLMERFITGQALVETGPAGLRLRAAPGRPGADGLRLLSMDIETDFRTDLVLSVAVSVRGRGAALDQVILVRDGSTLAWPETAGDALPAGTLVQVVADEAALLRATMALVAELDPDVLTGWNLVGFDLRVLQERCRKHQLPCVFGRDQAVMRLVRSQGLWGERLSARLAGRVVLDGLECLRSAGYSFASFSLEAVSQTLLGRGKSITHVANRAPEILRMYREAPVDLVRYNLDDARLVLDIFAHTEVLDLVLERVRLTGLPMVRWSGSVGAFDNLYLPRLHRRGWVAPAPGSGSTGASPGGYVLGSRPGLYRDVLVLDFKSLYPSIIRSFLIDPLGLALGLEQERVMAAGGAAVGPPGRPVPGFKGAQFARDGGLLPQIITELWAARDLAKQARNGPLSQAVKLLMNSFYGVLGTSLCRFFDARLASSITLRGHQVLQESRDWLEQQGVAVIYGDTDSLFVHLPDRPAASVARATGARLAQELSAWWSQRLQQEMGLQSCLEMEFETHYLHFMMPTVRGAEAGSKKRYAGMVQQHPDAAPGSDAAAATALVFKGLESVRSDWSQLARDFQRSLYQQIFLGLPVQPLIRQTVADLVAGGLDGDLNLRRRLRKPLAEYTANVPPHVRAARQQQQAELAAGVPVSVQRGAWIDYVMTVNGPEPAAFRQSTIDHEFYLERQLQPVADAALQFLDTDFQTVLGRQGSLF